MDYNLLWFILVGVIFGSVVFSPAQAADLLAGLNYVNVHTAVYPGGEIRGQLIPHLNVAPVVICPANATVECGSEFTYTATITVVDTTPPVIVSTSVSPKVLWSANHKMIPVRVSAEVTDACGPTTWKIISISSNEAVNAAGSGGDPDLVGKRARDRFGDQRRLRGGMASMSVKSWFSPAIPQMNL